MSKGNLPQTEAGSSVAVAPGKAELLSFLKCQRGTGTGNTPQCAVISSSSVLKGFCPGKCSQRVSHLFRHSQRHVSPSASKFLQYYSFQSEFKVKVFFSFDLIYTRFLNFIYFSQIISSPVHPWGMNLYIIPDNRFKSHGWTLYLKKKRNLTQKSLRGSADSLKRFHSFVSSTLSCQEPNRKQKSLV